MCYAWKVGNMWRYFINTQSISNESVTVGYKKLRSSYSKDIKKKCSFMNLRALFVTKNETSKQRNIFNKPFTITFTKTINIICFTRLANDDRYFNGKGWPSERVELKRQR